MLTIADSGYIKTQAKKKKKGAKSNNAGKKSFKLRSKKQVAEKFPQYPNQAQMYN